jgi:hypothetical protein
MVNDQSGMLGGSGISPEMQTWLGWRVHNAHAAAGDQPWRGVDA